MRTLVHFLIIFLFGCSANGDHGLKWNLNDSLRVKSIELNDQFPDTVVMKSVGYYRLELINGFSDSVIIPIDEHQFLSPAIIEVSCANKDCGAYQFIDNYYGVIIIPPFESRYFELKAVSVDTICPNCNVVWHLGFDRFENGRLAMDKGLKVSLKIK